MGELSQMLSFDSVGDDEFDVTLDLTPAAAAPAAARNGVAAAQPPRAAAARKPRYFVLKSVTPANIEQSLEKGIWATQVRGRWRLQPLLVAL